MVLGPDRNFGYGMLATKIFGDPQLLYRPDYESESAVHYSEARGSLFQTWYLRRFFNKHELPDDFVQTVDNAVETCEYGFFDHTRQQTNQKYRNNLNVRCREIVRMRFGLSDGKIWTLEEIGRQLYNEQTGRVGVTQERVRDLETRALRMLRKYKGEEIKASLTDTSIGELFGLDELG